MVHAESLWGAFAAATSEIVKGKGFDEVLRACPYFEGWWCVELCRRLPRRSDGWGIISFEPPAWSAEFSRRNAERAARTGRDGAAAGDRAWWPDLLLERSSPERCVAWVELKMLNLFRAEGVMEPDLRAMLMRGIGDRLGDFRDVWSYASTVEVSRTVDHLRRFGGIQRHQIAREYRDNPSLLASARPLSSAILLAVVPESDAALSSAFSAAEKRLLAPDAKWSSGASHRFAGDVGSGTGWRARLIAVVGPPAITRGAP